MQSKSSSSETTRLLAATHNARIARAVAKAVFMDFTTANGVLATATLLHEATMQVVAPELLFAAMEKGCKIAAVVSATTAARMATLLPSARASSRMGILLHRNSQKKTRPSDTRLSIAGPYCC